jgi:ABC-type sugar transport system permease subunit
MPREEGMYPSILRQVEIKVLVNVFFRVAVCVPMAIHIFVALVVRGNLRSDEFAMRNDVFRIFTNIACIAEIIESLSLGLFAIIHIRFDFPGKTIRKYKLNIF